MSDMWLIWLSPKLNFVHAGKEVADRWYDEVKQYNFNRPGFSSGTGELYMRGVVFVVFVSIF